MAEPDWLKDAVPVDDTPEWARESTRKAPAKRRKGFWQNLVDTARDVGQGAVSTARLAANAALGGFGDEITGAIADPVGAVREAVAKTGLVDSDPRSRYVQVRDAQRQIQRQDRANVPMPIEVAAEVVGSLLPVGRVMKAASTAGRLGLAALGGASAGTGYSEAKDAAGLARDAGVGALAGAAGQALGEAVPVAQKALGRAAKRAKSRADTNRLIQAGASTPRELEDLRRLPGTDAEKVQILREMGLLPRLGRTGGQAEKAAAIASQEGEAVRDVIRAAEDRGVVVDLRPVSETLERAKVFYEGIPGAGAGAERAAGLQREIAELAERSRPKIPKDDPAVAQRLLAEYENATPSDRFGFTNARNLAETAPPPGRRKRPDNAPPIASDADPAPPAPAEALPTPAPTAELLEPPPVVTRNPAIPPPPSEALPVSFRNAQDIKAFYDDAINWRDDRGLGSLSGFRQQMRGALNRAMEEAVTEQLPDLAPGYLDAKRRFQLAREVAELGDRINTRQALRQSGTGDILAATFGGTVGGGPGAAAATAARAVTKFRAPAIKATTQEIAAKLLSAPSMGPWAETLQRAAQKGPAAFSAQYYLLHRTNPAFREAIAEAEAEQ